MGCPPSLLQLIPLRHILCLQDHGLRKALERFVDDIKSRTAVDIKLNVDPDIYLVESAENHLYRMIQEATQNALKHSNCKSLLITLKRKAGKTHFRCADDGDGISQEDINNGAAFKTLKERTELLQGTYNVQGTPDTGTKIEITF